VQGAERRDAAAVRTLTIALSERNPTAVLPLLAECGVDIDGATPEFAMIATIHV
jgi:hypothetical protein